VTAASNGQFRYRAATPDGQFVEGVMQAASQQSVLDGLRRQHLYPVRVDAAPAVGAAVRGRRLGRRAAVVVWTRNLASLLGAGVPLDRALAFTVQYAGHEGLADAVRDVRRSVQGGASLAGNDKLDVLWLTWRCVRRLRVVRARKFAAVWQGKIERGISRALAPLEYARRHDREHRNRH